MNDIAERVRALGKELDAGYDGERTTQTLGTLHTRLRRQRATRVALAGGAFLCLSVAGIWAVRSKPHMAMPAQPQPEGVIRLADGSVVRE